MQSGMSVSHGVRDAWLADYLVFRMWSAYGSCRKTPKLSPLRAKTAALRQMHRPPLRKGGSYG
jgi:hypothetical protein